MQAKKSKGFTLIELMVTVVVLAILAIMAFPSLRDMVQRARVKGAADAAIALVGEARTGAVKAGRDVHVSLTTSGSTWCVGATAAPDPGTAGNPYPQLSAADADDACDCTDASACKVGSERLIVAGGDHPNVAINGTPSPLVIDGKLGLQRAATSVSVPTTTNLVTFAYGSYLLRVQVSPGGMPSACVPSGPSIPGYSTC